MRADSGFICADIGNTSIKLTSFSEGGIDEKKVASMSEAVKEIVGSGIQARGYCTTRFLSPAEMQEIESAGLWRFDAGCRLPLKVAYATPNSLGPDRLASALGAWNEFGRKAVFLADVGTALTLDVVDSNGVYRGGAISPGVRMRFEALHHYTSKLPLVEERGEVPEFGYDTATSIRSGVVRGVVWEIVGAYRNAVRRLGCRTLALTGGGASGLMPFLEKEVGEGLHYCPELVALGLKEAYRYNHEI